FGFQFLLSFLRRTRRMALLQSILLLGIVWFYTLMTGLSTAACRAATMFSFFIIGKEFHEEVNSYNLIVASALFLLCINPFLLMHVGFELSYAGVFGIVYLQPKIYNCFDSNYWLIR